MSDGFSAGEWIYRLANDEDSSFGADGVEEGEEEDLEAKLRKAGVTPVGLGKAPFASWVLARVAHLAQGKLGFETGDTQHNDGGGYAVELEAFDRKGTRVAAVQIQGTSDGVALLVRSKDEPASHSKAIIGALASEPDALSPFAVHVRDPEWAEDPAAYAPRPSPGSKNSYGWDGVDWLGGGNVRDRSKVSSAEGSSASPRVAAILELVKSGATWEWTSLQGRSAVRLVHPSGGREIKTLTDAEKKELETRLTK